MRIGIKIPNKYLINQKFSNYLELVNMYNKFLYRNLKFIFDIVILKSYFYLLLKLLYFRIANK